jgi:hypothetical protein
MKACEICFKELKRRQKKLCSRRCAARYLSVLYHGKGGKSAYITMRLNGRKIKYHRFVWERANGRKLRRGEIVHHKNGNKRDNRPENLEVVASAAEHLRIHNYLIEEQREARRKRRAAVQRHFSELGW